MMRLGIVLARSKVQVQCFFHLLPGGFAWSPVVPVARQSCAPNGALIGSSAVLAATVDWHVLHLLWPLQRMLFEQDIPKEPQPGRHRHINHHMTYPWQTTLARSQAVTGSSIFT